MAGLWPVQHQVQRAVFFLSPLFPQQQTNVLAPPCPALVRNSLHTPNGIFHAHRVEDQEIWQYEVQRKVWNKMNLVKEEDKSIYLYIFYM